MTTATTTLFSQSNVAALMITGKSPRFEITLGGTVQQTFPATRSWKREQKLAVEAAQALLAGRDGARIDAALSTLPLVSAGIVASRSVIAYAVVVNADGSRTLTPQGGKNAAFRSAILRTVCDFLLSHGLHVTVGSGTLTISAPLPGDDCAEEDDADLAA